MAREASAAAGGRRERYRAQTREEVKDLALKQIRVGGPEALSLNAIGKEMGVSGPAIYRYFAGRKELLAELVTDAYRDLADVLERAAADEAEARERVIHMAAAYRDWALKQPHRYHLLFSSFPGSGLNSSDALVREAHRSMSAILSVLEGLTAGSTKRSKLDRQLEGWLRKRSGPKVRGAVARAGVAFWTRLHGVLSLELHGHFESMGFDPGLIYDAEVDDFVSSLKR